MNIVSKMSLVLTTVAACVLVGCASQKNGYGASLGNREDAELRQQVADATVAPDSRQFYLSLIEKMQHEGLYFASLAHIDEFKKKFGTAPDIRLLQGNALLKTEQPEEARSVYETLIDTNVAAPAWHGIGLVDAQRSNWRSAVAALRKAVDQEPTNAQFVSDLGFAYLKSGDLENARVPLAQAAELAPNDRRIVGNLALFLMASGDDMGATAVMDKALFPLPVRDTVRAMASQIHAAIPRQHQSVGTSPRAAVQRTGHASLASADVHGHLNDTSATTRTGIYQAMAARLAASNFGSGQAGVGRATTEAAMNSRGGSDPNPDTRDSLTVGDQQTGLTAFSMQSMLNRFGRSN